MSSSTTRVCFSSTTLCAIVAPKVCAANRNTTPKPIAAMYPIQLVELAGSSTTTEGGCDSDISRFEGTSDSTTTE